MDEFFTVFIPLCAVAAVIGMSVYIASHSFKCKNCRGEFKIKWPRVIVTRHSGDEYILECPHCKTKGVCHIQPKRSDK